MFVSLVEKKSFHYFQEFRAQILWKVETISQGAKTQQKMVSFNPPDRKGLTADSDRPIPAL